MNENSAICDMLSVDVCNAHYPISQRHIRISICFSNVRSLMRCVTIAGKPTATPVRNRLVEVEKETEKQYIMKLFIANTETDNTTEMLESLLTRQPMCQSLMRYYQINSSDLLRLRVEEGATSSFFKLLSSVHDPARCGKDELDFYGAGPNGAVVSIRMPNSFVSFGGGDTRWRIFSENDRVAKFGYIQCSSCFEMYFHYHDNPCHCPFFLQVKLTYARNRKLVKVFCLKL